MVDQDAIRELVIHVTDEIIDNEQAKGAETTANSSSDESCHSLSIVELERAPYWLRAVMCRDSCADFGAI